MQPPSSVASVAGIMCVSSTFLLVAILMGHLACAAAAAGSSTPQLPKLAGKFEEIDGTEVVSQLPEQQPKGVLLAFHGCSHAATDWWPQSATCAACIGLPEEVLITSTALARGYAVVAISSRDRNHRRCWAIPHQPRTHTVDTLSVVEVVAQLQKREAFRDLPLYALGASSGGAFALAMAAVLPLSALCSQIMALPGSWYKAFLEQPPQEQLQQLKTWHQSPVLFVHMPRDQHTAARVKESVEIRHGKGLTTHVIEQQPQPLTEQLLSRVPELSKEGLGQQLLKLFRSKGLTNSSGLLVQDPRHSHWHDVVKSSKVAGLAALELTPDQSGLSEILNMAYASHEIIADTTAQMLDFFEKQPVAGAADH